MGWQWEWRSSGSGCMEGVKTINVHLFGWQAVCPFRWLPRPQNWELRAQNSALRIQTSDRLRPTKPTTHPQNQTQPLAVWVLSAIWFLSCVFGVLLFCSRAAKVNNSSKRQQNLLNYYLPLCCFVWLGRRGRLPELKSKPKGWFNPFHRNLAFIPKREKCPEKLQKYVTKDTAMIILGEGIYLSFRNLKHPFADLLSSDIANSNFTLI